ncbi:hypothetical protein JOB18_045441 [Solea senegalensis]|uniref:Uncharacterized protein n=1 Tax=Solea senegalensis TaxID=28829 RepID=A0AAV6PMJ1_SOLSE|nr:hypothetical protein JOB18_045441 [Solea senegalensis]
MSSDSVTVSCRRAVICTFIPTLIYFSPPPPPPPPPPSAASVVLPLCVSSSVLLFPRVRRFLQRSQIGCLSPQGTRADSPSASAASSSLLHPSSLLVSSSPRSILDCVQLSTEILVKYKPPLTHNQVRDHPDLSSLTHSLIPPTLLVLSVFCEVGVTLWIRG